MWRKGNASAVLVEMQTGAATVESSVEFLQKLKMCFDSEILLLEIYPMNPGTPIQTIRAPSFS